MPGVLNETFWVFGHFPLILFGKIKAKNEKVMLYFQKNNMAFKKTNHISAVSIDAHQCYMLKLVC